MTKERKIQTGVTIFGVLLLLTGNGLLMMAGVVAVLVIPIQEWTDWTGLDG